MSDGSRVPRATYRVQLHAGFTLDDAAAIVPYLADLGVSHLYASPILQAAPGSTHGYDVVDHSRVSRELGGEAAFNRLTDALRAREMGLVLDIVPNHMAIGEENKWWWDVLQHGHASRFAGYFDVDWDPPESRLRNVILLPMLGDHYGRVLEAGSLRLARREGTFVVEHGDRAFPIDPQTFGAFVMHAADGTSSDELAFIGSALHELPPSTVSDGELIERRQRDADVLTARLQELAVDDHIARALDAEVDSVNGQVDLLDELLDEQNYRLALWRSASRDLGYRRFFDIDDLIGLRVEDERVFAATHELILRWVKEGRVDGLRIDHPDGLRDPAGYFARLRAAAPDVWIVAEKILEPGEELPSDWPIDGSTGYGFANLAAGLLIDPAGEPQMTELWASLADEDPASESIVVEARAEVLSSVLGSDVNRLTDLFLSVCEANRRYRDFTRHELHHALREVAAALPVYRTYVRARDRHVADVDARLIGEAVALAAERRPDLDPEIFAFLGRILRLEIEGEMATELAMRFQQLTPAAMAKGVEDTAFYRYHRLVALNEVGGDPGQFGTDAAAAHATLGENGRRWPRAMLTLSTHDTKRSADVRARLALLSQDPAGWEAGVARLRSAAEAHRSGPELPTEADAYLFFQTVLGAWPIDANRAARYLEKATREAKLRTSWTDPNAEYDAALDRYARGAMGDAAFIEVVETTVAPLIEAGRRASLAQLALQMTAPGVPDIYQGSELWDLSLVDPDNRRPVDYDERRRMLAEVTGLSAADAWGRADAGVPKLWLIAHLLELRRRRPEVFAGEYRPLVVDGRSDSAFAFARGDALVTVIPRRFASCREGAAIALPEGEWHGLDGQVLSNRTNLSDLFDCFPVAILERTT